MGWADRFMVSAQNAEHKADALDIKLFNCRVQVGDASDTKREELGANHSILARRISPWTEHNRMSRKQIHRDAARIFIVD